MATIDGWARRAAATASRRNRATKLPSAARCGWRILTATCRARTSSVPPTPAAMPPDGDAARRAGSGRRAAVPPPRRPSACADGRSGGGSGGRHGAAEANAGRASGARAPCAGGRCSATRSTQVTPRTRGPPWVPMTGPMTPDADLVAAVRRGEQVEELVDVGRLAVAHAEVLDRAGARATLSRSHCERLPPGARLARLLDLAGADVDDRLDRQQACRAAPGRRRCGRPS